MATKTQKSIELNENEVVEIEGVKINSKLLTVLKALQKDGNDQVAMIRESMSDAISVLLCKADGAHHDEAKKIFDISINLSYSREMISSLAAFE